MAKANRYISHGKLQIDSVLTHITNFVSKNERKTFINDKGQTFTPKVGTLRLVTFKTNGVSCCYCGIEATHFQLDEHVSGYTDKNNPRPHLNLYANDMLMSKEHVLPKAYGGQDILSNMMTCCSECNNLRLDLLLPSINGQNVVDSLLNKD